MEMQVAAHPFEEFKVSFSNEKRNLFLFGRIGFPKVVI